MQPWPGPSTSDPNGFLRFAEGLSTPTVYNAIKCAERLGNIARYSFPESTWRHFERLVSFPRGRISLGDAICRFNPVWCQGMKRCRAGSGCAASAPRARPRSARRVGAEIFRRGQRIDRNPWAQAAIPDFALPQTTGQRPADSERRLKFGGALSRLAAQDPEVHRLVVEVRHLLKPSSALRDLVERVDALMAQA